MSSLDRCADGASFGLATLLELFEDDREAVAELLDAALASIDDDMIEIDKGAPLADHHAIVEATHRIKGTSGSIGAKLLVDISSRIEAGLTRTHEPTSPGALAELRAAVAAVRADILAYTQG